MNRVMKVGLKGIKVAALVLVGALLLASAVLAMATQIAPLQTAEKALSLLVGRDVRFADAHLSFNETVVIEVSDLHVANKSWGTVPDLLHIQNLKVGLDRHSLLKRQFFIRSLEIDDAALVLERNSEGKGNWRNGSPPLFPPSAAEQASQSRASFPTILSLALRNARVIYRLRNGTELKIDLTKIDLSAHDAMSPVSLKVEGAYNDIPVRMRIDTSSFDRLHATEEPLDATIEALGAMTKIDLKGQFTDPLNFDGIDAHLRLETSQLGKTASLVGGSVDYPVSLMLEGHFRHEGDHWQLDNAQGELAKNILRESTIELNEGQHREPDHVDLKLNFERLTLDALIPGSSSTRTTTNGNEGGSDLVDAIENPSTLLETRLSAATFAYKKFNGSDLSLQAEIQAGKAGVSKIVLHNSGGNLTGSLMSYVKEKNLDVVMHAELAHMDLAELLQMMTRDPHMAGGSLDGGIDLEGEGRTIRQLKENIHGAVVLSAMNGVISKKLVRLASSDVRAFFENESPQTPVQCFAAFTAFEGGVGHFSPLILRTGNGTFTGGGTVDLRSDDLNLTLASVPKSTSALALDIPVHISGKLGQPAVRPVLNAHRPEPSAPIPEDVEHPRWLKRLIAENPCFRPTASTTP